MSVKNAREVTEIMMTVTVINHEAMLVIETSNHEAMPVIAIVTADKTKEKEVEETVTIAREKILRLIPRKSGKNMDRG
jgi:hypothetical protein